MALRLRDGREFDSCDSVRTGDVVYVRHAVPGEPTRLVPCTVTCVEGQHARVTNEALGIDQWFRVALLYRLRTRGRRA